MSALAAATKPSLSSQLTGVRVFFECVCRPTGFEATVNETTGECIPCPANFFRGLNETQCVPCGLGTSTRGLTAQDSCQNCPPGTFNDLEGGTCQECPLGAYMPDEGETGCLECPPQTFTNETGLADCFSCPDGTDADAPGSEECASCPQGYFRFAEMGGLPCTACPPGEYADNPETSDCLACPPGTATATYGTITCNLCDIGYYNPNSGEDRCVRCPDGNLTEVAGAISVTECTVRPDVFDYEGRGTEILTELQANGTVTGGDPEVSEDVRLLICDLLIAESGSGLNRDSLSDGLCNLPPFNTFWCLYDGGDCCAASCQVQVREGGREFVFACFPSQLVGSDDTEEVREFLSSTTAVDFGEGESIDEFINENLTANTRASFRFACSPYQFDCRDPELQGLPSPTFGCVPSPPTPAFQLYNGTSFRDDVCPFNETNMPNDVVPDFDFDFSMGSESRPNDERVRAVDNDPCFNSSRGVTFQENFPESESGGCSGEFLLKVFRTWTAVDESGNAGSSTQTITVVDRTPPRLLSMPAASSGSTVPFSSLGLPNTIPSSLSQAASDLFGDAEPVQAVDDSNSFSNDCFGVQTIQPMILPTAPDTLEACLEFNLSLVGSVRVFWEATDAANNTVREAIDFGVEDDLAPILQRGGNVISTDESSEETLSLTDFLATGLPESSLNGITAQDAHPCFNLSGDAVTVEVVQETPECNFTDSAGIFPVTFARQVTRRIFSVDPAGNQSPTVTQIFNLQDDTKPSVVVINVERSTANFSDFAASGPDAFEDFVFFTATDDSDCLEEQLEASDPVSLTSNCDEAVTSGEGISEIALSVRLRDLSNNMITEPLLTVQLIDNLPPMIEAPPFEDPLIVLASSLPSLDSVPEVPDLEASDNDDCFGTQTVAPVITPVVPSSEEACDEEFENPDQPGEFLPQLLSYNVVWSVSDRSGNTETLTRIVVVLDDIPPLLLVMRTAESPFEAVTMGASVEETVEANNSALLSEAGSGLMPPATDVETETGYLFRPIPTVGEATGLFSFTRQWTATDEGGNAAVFRQNFSVVDVNPPELVSLPEAMQTVNTSELPEGATGPERAPVSAVDDDASTIEVNDDLPPVFEDPPFEDPLIVLASSLPSLDSVPEVPDLEASDNDDCFGTQTVTPVITPVVPSSEEACDEEFENPDQPGEFLPQLLSYNVVWSVSDRSGNTETLTRIVVVLDDVPPLLLVMRTAESPFEAVTMGASVEETVKANNSALLSEAGSDLMPPATDVETETGYLFRPIPTVGEATGLFSFTRQWTATDEGGNAAVFRQNFSVVDVNPPELVSLPEAMQTVNTSELPEGATGPERAPVSAVDDDASVISVFDDSAPVPVLPPDWQAEVLGLISEGPPEAPSVAFEDGDPTCPPPVVVFTEEEVALPISSLNMQGSGSDEGRSRSSVVSAETNSGSSVDTGCFFTQITRTWTATDRSGNTGSIQQIISLEDDVPPLDVSPPSNGSLCIYPATNRFVKLDNLTSPDSGDEDPLGLAGAEDISTVTLTFLECSCNPTKKDILTEAVLSKLPTKMPDASDNSKESLVEKLSGAEVDPSPLDLPLPVPFPGSVKGTGAPDLSKGSPIATPLSKFGDQDRAATAPVEGCCIYDSQTDTLYVQATKGSDGSGKGGVLEQLVSGGSRGPLGLPSEIEKERGDLRNLREGQQGGGIEMGIPKLNLDLPPLPELQSGMLNKVGNVESESSVLSSLKMPRLPFWPFRDPLSLSPASHSGKESADGNPMTREGLSASGGSSSRVSDLRSDSQKEKKDERPAEIVNRVQIRLRAEDGCGNAQNFTRNVVVFDRPPSSEDLPSGVAFSVDTCREASFQQTKKGGLPEEVEGSKKGPSEEGNSGNPLGKLMDWGFLSLSGWPFSGSLLGEPDEGKGHPKGPLGNLGGVPSEVLSGAASDSDSPLPYPKEENKLGVPELPFNFADMIPGLSTMKPIDPGNVLEIPDLGLVFGKVPVSDSDGESETSKQ
uniref:Tyrosine-protein kinase ephrin type A/B receptor-like domain-containing protein n=1 Tax=Chromera velia CCMP2878 TaxID=1169474 RepID=A0A0G4GLC1_9ALVE|eukprot:Cvel_698.t1-p1 / transcript=Cvel_698.t1 / gene=Cvel_698 / organism=Chromera_velia_CCMP2878 / gene_product=Sushi, von Willebrand factor type A, EGF and, putative / transcript_product=Sushi, von Willebrand factor type A, EGF and, putative / location=Cvel_scaffold21:149242-162460(-) / protein_length=1990 / sequence_SO=supercontig / SO=protein_coding / is_pseudo=false